MATTSDLHLHFVCPWKRIVELCVKIPKIVLLLHNVCVQQRRGKKKEEKEAALMH
jgi:hypothetical protein